MFIYNLLQIGFFYFWCIRMDYVKQFIILQYTNVFSYFTAASLLNF